MANALVRLRNAVDALSSLAPRQDRTETARGGDGSSESRWPRPTAAALIIMTWALIFVPLALHQHYTLRTNGFDLSVFDYSLSSLANGGGGYVPFMGQSIFSHHFMPTLALLSVVYQLFSSAVFLVLLQLLFMAVAAGLFYRHCKTLLPPVLAVALLVVLLFGRRSYSAVMSFFYIESLELLLVFALVWALATRRWIAYSTLLLLSLGCKEDMAVYLGVFGLLLLASKELRKVGSLTALAAALWLIVALGVAIPTARELDGLPATNPFLEARYATSASTASAQAIAHRVFSARSAAKLFNVFGGVVFTCLASPALLAVAIPGIVLNLAAAPGTEQASLSGHYLWPILPWVFLAAALGAKRLIDRWPRSTPWLAAALVLVALADSPLWKTLRETQWPTPNSAAATIRDQLDLLPPDVGVLAMPNLIPHIPNRDVIEAIGRRISDLPLEYVALSKTGDLWPLDSAAVQQLVEQYRDDTSYEVVSNGPLYLFHRHEPASAGGRSTHEANGGTHGNDARDAGR